MLRAVLFDAAGTLFESREPIGVIYARIAGRYGMDADAADVAAGFRRAFHGATPLAFGPGLKAGELRELERRWWRDRVRETFAKLGDFPEFDAYFDELFAYFADPAHWVAMAGASALLGRLRDRGLKLGVVSNFDSRLYHILDGLGLSRFFDTVIISSEVGFAKPSPKIFIAALLALSAKATETLHVGDSEALDVGGANAAGIASVLLDPAHDAPPLITGKSARISRLAMLPETIERMPFP